jgi:hypothetical protein
VKKCIGLLLVVFIFIQYTPQFFVFASETSLGGNIDMAFYDDIIDKEAAFIANCQLSGGAIATQAKPKNEDSDDGYRVVPYFSNLAAVGLLEKVSYEPVVKKYMNWYFSHLNTSETDYNKVNGTIYDYSVAKDGVTETPEKRYDSTDSYAATFISLLRKYVEVTGDKEYILDHQNQLNSIGEAMLSTFDRGLTYAKPDYRIQYLMDNTEVYKGLDDMVWVYDNVIKNMEKSKFYLNYKQEVEDTIEKKFWDEKTKSYANYRNDGMIIVESSLTNFYSDATAQLFPIWEEMLSSDDPRALEIYNTFCKNFPGWPEMKKAGDYPWAIMVYTAAIMGDKIKVDTYLKTAKEKFIDKGHPLNWYNLEAGMTLLAASKMKKSIIPEVKLYVESLENGQKISKFPFEINGSSTNTAKVVVSIVNNSTKQMNTIETNTDKDGKWSLNVPQMLNGEYTVTAKSEDKFHNYCSTVTMEIKLEINMSNDKITNAMLNVEKSTLKRGESTKLKLSAFMNNSEKKADPSKLKIEYESNMPELLAIDSKGGIKLKQLNRVATSFQVWANITFENNLIQTNKITINISKSSLTLYDEIMDVQAKWIAGSQLASGAFPITGKAVGGKFTIDPMYANYAAMGLIGRSEYAKEVKKYLDWYVANLNWPDANGVLGTVNNYTLDASGKKIVSFKANKTSAALIGSFMSLVRRYGDMTGDYKTLGQFELDSMTGGNGMMLSQDVDGLFWQKPDSKIKKLDENAIALKGLNDSIWLQRNASTNASAADNFKSNAYDPAIKGFEKILWDSVSSSYRITSDEKGKKSAVNWSDIRQAAMELQPICNNIIAVDSAKAKSLYKKFNSYFPDWHKLKKTDYGFEVVAYASVLMGDKLKYEAFFKTYKQKYIDTGSFKKLDSMKLGIIMLAAEKACK